MKMRIREGRRIGSTPWFAWTMAMLLSLSQPGPAADDDPAQLPNRSEVAAENQVVKAAMERVSDGAAPSTRREAPARLPAARNAETSPKTQPAADPAQGRIVLQPQAGAMQVRAQVPRLDNQAFGLGIPETIGCREAMLVNFPEAKIEWQGPDADGVVTCSWGPGGRISYTLRLVPAEDFGDIGPGEGSTTVSRLYLAKGTRDDFLQRLAADRPGLSARQKWARPVGAARGTKPHGRMEEMSPDELETVLAEAPVAFVPLGTYEHHGFHLPVCFDGIKAHALCERVAQRTGGTVLPTFFYGTGGGHVGYKWTLMLPEPQITPLIEATLDHLARQGFKVVVLLTGHYPQGASGHGPSVGSGSADATSAGAVHWVDRAGGHHASAWRRATPATTRPSTRRASRWH